MIIIQQDFKLNNLSILLSKYGNTSIEFNGQAIKDDIDKATKELEKVSLSKHDKAITNTKINIKNYKAIIKYLENVYKKACNGPLSINWSLDNNIIKSYPIEMKNIDEYSVYITDYINMGNEHMIQLDYTELADILAFDIMYRDLDETHASMEEKLNDIGIISIYDSGLISKYFDDSPYKLSKMLRINDSPYLDPTRKTIYDYFGDSQFNADSYRNVVEYSCKYAMSFIVEDLFNKYASEIKIKLACITETGIYIIVSDKIDDNIINSLSEHVLVRTFGRKFELVPKVNVF